MAPPSTSPALLKIDGKEYVVLPKSEYQRLTGAGAKEQLIDAKSFTRSAIASSLRKAREHAGLSQSQLARKLRVSQPMVSAVEAGRTQVSEKFALRVLKACKLPPDWVAPPDDVPA
jgi:ribosome-binding protein aMBF1 (putative translation factor)